MSNFGHCSDRPNLNLNKISARFENTDFSHAAYVESRKLSGEGVEYLRYGFEVLI